LARKDPFEWPTVKLLLRKIEDEEGRSSTKELSYGISVMLFKSS